jgi:hypothetical protein
MRAVQVRAPMDVPMPFAERPQRHPRPRIFGSAGHPVAKALCDVPSEPATGTLVLLGARFAPTDNALLLVGVRNAWWHRRRLVLIHLGARGGALLRCSTADHRIPEWLSVELPAVPPGGALRAALRLACSDGTGEPRVGETGTFAMSWRPFTLPPPSHGQRGPRDLVAVATGGLGGLGLHVAALLSYQFGLHPVVSNDEQRLRPGSPTDRRRASLTLQAAAGVPQATTVIAEWSMWARAGMAHNLGLVAQARRGGLLPKAGMRVMGRLLALPACARRAQALILRGSDQRSATRAAALSDEGIGPHPLATGLSALATLGLDDVVRARSLISPGTGLRTHDGQLPGEITGPELEGFRGGRVASGRAAPQALQSVAVLAEEQRLKACVRTVLGECSRRRARSPSLRGAGASARRHLAVPVGQPTAGNDDRRGDPGCLSKQLKRCCAFEASSEERTWLSRRSDDQIAHRPSFADWVASLLARLVSRI